MTWSRPQDVQLVRSALGSTRLAATSFAARSALRPTKKRASMIQIAALACTVMSRLPVEDVNATTGARLTRIVQVALSAKLDCLVEGSRITRCPRAFCSALLRQASERSTIVEVSVATLQWISTAIDDISPRETCSYDLEILQIRWNVSRIWE